MISYPYRFSQTCEELTSSPPGLFFSLFIPFGSEVEEIERVDFDAGDAGGHGGVVGQRPEE